jgi:O-acetyl-ADP-ribose deacetylase
MNNQVIARIRLIQGDITKVEVDAIVNAANKTLLGGGGVDGAIHRAAGPELYKECKGLGGCSTGDAKITGGYNLSARYVIHTVGPVFSGKAEDRKLLASCYLNSLRLAEKHGIRSIAFPAISCGVYGYPIQEACQIALTTTSDFLEKNNTVQEVIFVLFSTSDLEVYQSTLKNLR